MSNFLKKTSKWVIRSIVGGYKTNYLQSRIQVCIIAFVIYYISRNFGSSYVVGILEIISLVSRNYTTSSRNGRVLIVRVYCSCLLWKRGLPILRLKTTQLLFEKLTTKLFKKLLYVIWNQHKFYNEMKGSFKWKHIQKP